MSGAHASPWFYHASVPALEADELLGRVNREGAFLVRDSETVPGGYSLCLWHDGRVHKYRILREAASDEGSGSGSGGIGGRLYVKAEAGVEERKYDSLDQLIEDYVSRKSQNGLVASLQVPVACRRAWADEYELEHCVENDDALTYRFQQQMQRIDLSRLDGDFMTSLKRYVDCQLLHDAKRAREQGVDGLLGLRDVMRDNMASLVREMEYFRLKLSVLEELFCGTKPPNQPGALSRSRVRPMPPSQDLPVVLNSLASMRDSYATLEEQIHSTLEACLTELSERGGRADDDVNVVPSASNQAELSISRPIFVKVPERRLAATKQIFRVRTLAATRLLQKELILALDIANGQLYCVKSSQKSLDQSSIIDHSRITGLVKSSTNMCVLHVKYSDRRKDSFCFNDARQRELFCQLMTHTKRSHSSDPEPDVLSLFVGTWNMAEEIPSWSLVPWLKSIGQGKTRDLALTTIPHDMYVIGTQESANTEREWERCLKMFLEHSFHLRYETVSMHTLWGIRLIVLCKPELVKRISNIQTSHVKTGFANAMGNKGAVAVGLKFCATSLCFVNAHLASGSEKNLKREQNYRDILRGLSLGGKPPPGTDVTHTYDHVFWFGDLNFRLDEDMPAITKRLEKRELGPLLTKDQLKQSQTGRTAFQQFNEEEILFQPTYRYEKGQRDQWSWQKIKGRHIRVNVPSWTDRVLWCSRRHTYIHNTSYGCNLDYTTSDHKPVFASFQIGITNEYAAVPNPNPSQIPKACISVESVIVKLRNGAKPKASYRLSFYGSLLTEPGVQWGPNTHFLSGEETRALAGPSGIGSQACYPVWRGSLPQIELMAYDKRQVTEEHLVIAVRSIPADEGSAEETAGCCVISLKSLLGDRPHMVEGALTSYGDEVGIVVLMGQLLVDPAWTKKKTRSYELVTVDTEAAEGEKRDDPASVDFYEPVEAYSGAVSRPLAVHRSPTRQRTRSLNLSVSTVGSPGPARKQPVGHPVYNRSQTMVVHNQGYAGCANFQPIPLAEAAAAAHTVERPAPALPPKLNNKTSNGSRCGSRRGSADSGTEENSSSSAPPLPERQSSTGTAEKPPSNRLSRSNGHSAFSELSNRRGRDASLEKVSTPRSVGQEAKVNGIQMRESSTEDEISTACSITSQPSKEEEQPPSDSGSEVEYSTLLRPESLEHWLECLQLTAYLPAFRDSRWNTLDTARLLTEDNLRELGIDCELHRRRIMGSLHLL